MASLHAIVSRLAKEQERLRMQIFELECMAEEIAEPGVSTG